MGKSKRKAEKAVKSLLGPEAAKQLKPKAKAPKEVKSDAKTSQVNGSIQKPAVRAEPPWRNKEKPLVLCARGITFRYRGGLFAKRSRTESNNKCRHLMTDLMQLIPHHKTDSKLDTKHDWNVINEVAELKNATTAMFFEARKKKDLYIWLSKVGTGPCVRFYCTNIHTMAELKLSGNHLKGSRPILSFDAAFDQQPHLQVMKELLQQVFVTPKGHPKSKPFFDHVISFSYCDGRIWLRNYQVVTPAERKELNSEGSTLVEVGPRVTLQPIKVFAGSFRGKVLFENPEFIHPNAVRSYEKRKEAGVYKRRKDREASAKEHKAANILPEDELSNKRVFAEAAAHDDEEDGEVLDEELLEADGDVLQHVSTGDAGLGGNSGSSGDDLDDMEGSDDDGDDDE